MGAAWEEMSSDTDMIIRSFKKCGISVPIDGSADSDINIAGLDDYTVESGEDHGWRELRHGRPFCQHHR